MHLFVRSFVRSVGRYRNRLVGHGNLFESEKDKSHHNVEATLVLLASWEIAGTCE
jgi:hypothetical protein